MLAAPVSPFIVTSPFGPRPKVGKDGKPGPLHPGIDLHCLLGQEVRACESGYVRESRLSSNDPPDWRPDMPRPEGWPPSQPYPRVMGYGNLVRISHDDGSITCYCHLAKRLVEAGEHVEQGQVIGHAGSTGFSFGVHLHFEVRVEGGRAFVDPLTRFDPALTGLKP